MDEAIAPSMGIMVGFASPTLVQVPPKRKPLSSARPIRLWYTPANRPRCSRVRGAATLVDVPLKTKPTWRGRRLGQELRNERGDRRAEDVVAQLGRGWSTSKLSRIENGQHVPLASIRQLLRLYGTSPERTEHLLAWAELARRGTWLTNQGTSVFPHDVAWFAEIEQDAVAQRCYCEMLVPGLLQTQEYAREVLQGLSFSDDSAIEQRLSVRAERQQILDRDHPPRLTFIIAEYALRMMVGGPLVMDNQLQRLQEDAERPDVTLLVVPSSVGRMPCTSFPFTIFTMPGEDELEVVYAEQLFGNWYADDQETIRRYTLAFKAARSQALSPADSAATIAAIQKEFR